jgi:hypothetical protein
MRTEPMGPVGHLIADALARLGYSRSDAVKAIKKAAEHDGETGGYDRTALYKWIKGIHVPRQDSTRWIAVGLEIPLERLNKAIAEQTAQQEPARQLTSTAGPGQILPVDSDDVKRREFAKLLALAGITASGLDLDRWIAVLAGTRIDGPSLDDMEMLTADLMRRAASVTPSSLLPAVRGHLEGLCQALVLVPADLGSRAHSAAGRTALLAGYLMLQEERRTEADAHWSLAERFGDLAGDAKLRAVLGVHQAWRWQFEDPPYAIALLDRAESVLGPEPEPAAAVMVLSTRAGLLADASHADPAHAARAMRDLDHTHSSLSRMDAADDDLYVFQSVTGQAMESGCLALLYLGRHHDAATGLEQRLASIDPSALAQRSYATSSLGFAIAGMGELEHACDVLSTSLDLAESASAPRCARLVRERQQRWLADYDGPAARRLNDRLVAISGPSANLS